MPIKEGEIIIDRHEDVRTGKVTITYADVSDPTKSRQETEQAAKPKPAGADLADGAEEAGKANDAAPAGGPEGSFAPTGGDTADESDAERRELEKMRVADLEALAKKEGIKSPDFNNKAELVDLILENRSK